MKHISQYLLGLTIVSLSLLLISCKDDKEKAAQEYVNKARTLYNAGEYTKAKESLDSLDILYPKAVKQRKEGFALLQDVRRGINTQIIEESDSLLGVYNVELQDLLKLFTFQKNVQYQTKGNYVPKNGVAFSNNATGLRAGVIEDGTMFIESVYVGAQNHTKLKISSADGQSVETKTETGDGLNYRIGDIEIIRFTKMTENGMFEFINSRPTGALKVTLEGKHSISYNLSAASRNSILECYKLADLMSRIEEATNNKMKALALNDYLLNGGTNPEALPEEEANP